MDDKKQLLVAIRSHAAESFTFGQCRKEAGIPKDDDNRRSMAYAKWKEIWDSGAIDLDPTSNQRRNRPFVVKSKIKLNAFLSDVGLPTLESTPQQGASMKAGAVVQEHLKVPASKRLPPLIQELVDTIQDLSRRVEVLEKKIERVDALWYE